MNTPSNTGRTTTNLLTSVTRPNLRTGEGADHTSGFTTCLTDLDIAACARLHSVRHEVSLAVGLEQRGLEPINPLRLDWGLDKTGAVLVAQLPM
jgi:hypothetical protein